MGCAVSETIEANSNEFSLIDSVGVACTSWEATAWGNFRCCLVPADLELGTVTYDCSETWLSRVSFFCFKSKLFRSKPMIVGISSSIEIKWTGQRQNLETM